MPNEQIPGVEQKPEETAGNNNASLELWYGAGKPSPRPVPGTQEVATQEATAQSGEIPDGMKVAGQKIAIQGEPGSFSHEAALKLVADATIVPCALSADVFAAVSEGRVDCAVIPIENSIAGSVSEHFDLLLTHDVQVEQETLLRIRHNLIGLSGSAVDHIDRVFSHPVALAQCRKFLAAHPKMESFAFYDTAGSVKQLITLRDRHAGAIASEAAAYYYGAQILAANIEDNPENYTRFFLIRRTAKTVNIPDANKISLAFATENKPGALVAALTELSSLGLNLTKIESRPVQGKPWEYIFYVDCQLHAPADAAQAIGALRPHCTMIKSLGCYKAGTRPYRQLG